MSKTLNILHLEDSAYDMEFVYRYLRKARLDFTMKVVDNEVDFQKALKEFEPDVVLSDHSMPGFDSIQALEYFKSEGLDIPFILVTGAVSEEFAVRSLKMGADDYILKSNLVRLPNAIRRALEEKRIGRERDELIIKLRASLQEKDVLLNEIHHRVKNNLAIIASLLNLQAASTDNDNVKNLLQESENRVLSMSMIHEMLYQQEDFSKIAFAPYVHKLCSHISNNYKTDTLDVDFEIKAEDIYLEIGTAVPSALIINELITNSYKHAFRDREKGKISINIKQDGECMTITVSDDGVGLPEFKNPSTLGLSLIDGLSKQIGGKVSINRDQGTTFTIEISGS